MKTRVKVSPPSTNLPPIRSLDAQTQEDVLLIIAGLMEIYCPMSTPVGSAFSHFHPSVRKAAATESLVESLADSGYVSEANEDDDDTECTQKDVGAILADPFERSFTQRWLTGFVTRAEDCLAFTDEEVRESAIGDAYTLIETLSLAGNTEVDEGVDNAEGFRRDFVFQTAHNNEVRVFLHDKLAGTDSTDPDDVGLQSWGASIFFSRLLCGNPERFGFGGQSQNSPLRIIELGAGTGLVSLTLGGLLPMIGLGNSILIATDYHAAVLQNLAENVKANMADHEGVPILTCALDWSAPVWDSPLDRPADILIATDVIYSPLHAVWVKECASQILAPDGIFWMMVAVRQNGRFEGVSETVHKSFATPGPAFGSRQLHVIERERLEKPIGIGRGDESWYELFKIGWRDQAPLLREH